MTGATGAETPSRRRAPRSAHGYLAILMSEAAGWGRRVRALFTREVAGQHWDGILWGCGAVGLAGIVLSSFVPAASELAVLSSLTLFANGP